MLRILRGKNSKISKKKETSKKEEIKTGLLKSNKNNDIYIDSSSDGEPNINVGLNELVHNFPAANIANHISNKCGGFGPTIWESNVVDGADESENVPAEDAPQPRDPSDRYIDNAAQERTQRQDTLEYAIRRQAAHIEETTNRGIVNGARRANEEMRRQTDTDEEDTRSRPQSNTDQSPGRPQSTTDQNPYLPGPEWLERVLPNGPGPEGYILPPNTNESTEDSDESQVPTDTTIDTIINNPDTIQFVRHLWSEEPLQVSETIPSGSNEGVTERSPFALAGDAINAYRTMVDTFIRDILSRGHKYITTANLIITKKRKAAILTDNFKDKEVKSTDEEEAELHSPDREGYEYNPPIIPPALSTTEAAINDLTRSNEWRTINNILSPRQWFKKFIVNCFTGRVSNAHNEGESEEESTIKERDETQLCVSMGTKVMTSEGTVNIESLVTPQEEVPDKEE